MVDDDEIVLKITRLLLSKLGFTVVSAGDGTEAVEVFCRHKAEIRLVISDVSMPRMNGWETLIALRGIDPNIPVILVSGFSEEQVMEGIHSERPHAFLAKPYSLPALKEAINTIF